MVTTAPWPRHYCRSRSGRNRATKILARGRQVLSAAEIAADPEAAALSAYFVETTSEQLGLHPSVSGLLGVACDCFWRYCVS